MVVHGKIQSCGDLQLILSFFPRVCSAHPCSLLCCWQGREGCFPTHTLTAPPARSGCLVPALTTLLRASPPAALPREPGAELCSQSRSLRAEQVPLLPASICPKSHGPVGCSAPGYVQLALWRPRWEGRCRAQSHPAGSSHDCCASWARLPQAPAQPVFSVRSCCQVRKHCEWCQALICRHEKPSALLKGRTACCHSETGKGLS